MKSAITLLIKVVAVTLILSACEQEGPAEKAGEKVDEAIENVSDYAEDAADEAGDRLEEMGDKIKEKAQSVN